MRDTGKGRETLGQSERYREGESGTERKRRGGDRVRDTGKGKETLGKREEGDTE